MSNQIKKKFIKEKAIDGSKILLNEGEALKQQFNGDEYEVVKYDGDISKVRLANGIAATEDYVDDAIFIEATARQLADAELYSDVEREVLERIEGDEALQSAIDAEATDRQAGDAQTLQDAKDYTDAQIAAIPEVDLSAIESDISDLQAADISLQSAIDAEATARQDADGALQSQIEDVESALAQEVTDRQNADISLQSAIDAEKARIDAILDASDADKDSFAEIVQLINSVDTENDEAFASYVLSNNEALAQEVADRQAGDAQTLQDAKDYTDAQIAAIPEVDLSAIESDISDLQAADISLQSAIDAEKARIDALEAAAPTFNKMKITMQEGQLAYVDLAHDAIENSIVVSVGRVMIHATDDYTVSVEGGVTRLTFVGSLASPNGDEAIEVGDNVYVTYAYKS